MPQLQDNQNRYYLRLVRYGFMCCKYGKTLEEALQYIAELEKATTEDLNHVLGFPLLKK